MRGDDASDDKWAAIGRDDAEMSCRAIVEVSFGDAAAIAVVFGIAGASIFVESK